ncbi:MULTISPECIES: magnesium/cobalt transporter CorA [unclassified Duganella]|uniref:magnesium/cobalt transporter CorA n=1 Tax=unclassified Duganella TaxID=2636909 RepID=UPI000700C34F|nr:MULTISPECIES: magnesium/cobalt transporter CorA [unclassified Duganella]KQN79080.1 magnesium transporter [Duganella sp. Leaf61]MPQ59681.1 magnesium/cobalt transporter CorA [Duganella sp. FT27W]
MLLNCVAYEDGQKLADIPVEEISDYMEKPETFVWVALHEATPEELTTMQHEFGLHELAVEDASRGHQRPKIEEYGDSLFVVVKTVECRDGDVVLGEVDIFVGQNYVLSSRDGQSTKGFLGVRARAEREPHMLRKGPAFVLYALMDAIVDRYFPVLEMLETELEKIEELIFSQGKQRDNIERLYELKGKVTTVRHAVVPMMEAVGRLYGGRVPSMCLDTQDYFRDVHDHLHRISAALDTIRDTIATAIQVNLSMTAIEESEVNKRLAAWAAIFAIVTAFAGVWGMNFKFMPELEWKYGYPMALSIMIFVCWILHRRFKRAGWL